LSFNEEEITPGFWIHDVQHRPFEVGIGGTAVNSSFHETPARRYETINWDVTSVLHFLKHGTSGFHFLAESVKDAIVRVNYSCNEEVAKQLNRKQLEQALYDAGAFYVSEIKGDIQRVDRARDVTVNESLTVPQALAKWCENQGVETEETQALCAMTAELLESGV
jgi:exonuclease SbcC/exonuclease SbcD